MLMNFCDPSLLPKVKCNTACNEGNEVINLINGQDNGFMAYYAIRPPVHIDLEFICKIQLSHIIIWPCVGAQKSSGFKFSSKPHQNSSDYKDFHTVFLKPEDSGVFLYRNDYNYSNVSKPSNFSERYIQLSKFQTINATDNIRISIIKTENSVPTIKRIEVWGKVSRNCDYNTKTIIETLWNKRNDNLQLETAQDSREIEKSKNSNLEEDEQINQANEILNVPEDFLDPITFEIMTRPIVLPSGKIIDHSTLEKHQQSEAAWSRKLSDPFTGLPFNESRVPIPASALKERIDKFLLLNSNNEEIKKMPRVLGSKQIKRPAFLSELVIKKQKTETNESTSKEIQKETIQQSVQQTHRLPLPMLRKSRTINLLPKAVKKQCNDHQTSSRQIVNSSVIIQSRKIRNSNIIKCICCVDRILYKLPCKHIICRKMLLSGSERCSICNVLYKKSDPIKIYV